MGREGGRKVWREGEKKLTWALSFHRDDLTHNFALRFARSSFLPADSGCVGENGPSKYHRPEMNMAYFQFFQGHTDLDLNRETLDNSLNLF